MGSTDRPHNRAAAPRGREAWPKELFALALGTLLASVASAQYLETTIDLCPSGLGSVLKLDCIAVNPATHEVYVGGDGWVAVIDGAGLSYESRIPVGSRCRALTYVPEKNKLYAACWYGQLDGAVYVIDCGTNQVRARITEGERPHSLCYDPLDNKVYCGDYTSSTVSAIDLSGDSVVATIPVGTQPRVLCFNPVERKVYTANYESEDVTVIDATADTVVATLGMQKAPVSLTCNPQENKVYCGLGLSSGKVAIIDGAADTVLAMLGVAGQPNSIAYSPLTSRIYCANEVAIKVIDGVRDSVIRAAAMGYPWMSVSYNPTNGKIYAATDDGRMGVIDGVTDSLLVVFTLPDDSRRLAVDASLNRVYGTYMSTPSVACVDGAGDSLLETVRTGVNPVSICYNPVEDKVYTASHDNCGVVSVIDAATNSLLTTISVGGYPWRVVCDSVDNKVFVSLRSGHGVDSGVVVIDCRADTIRAVVPAQADPSFLCYYPQRGKIYCKQDHAVAVIDAAADSVMATIPVNWAKPGQMTVNYDYDKLYVADQYGNALTVICGTTDSVLTLVPVHTAGGFTIHYNPKAEKLYAMSGTGVAPYVTIISGRNDSILTVLDNTYEQIACQSPARSDVFMYGTRGVAVVDGRGDSVLARISTPSPLYSYDIAYDIGQDKVYCSEDTSVVIIDALTYRVIRTIPVGVHPWHIVWVPRHSRVFVANASSSSVSVIRDTSLAVTELEGAVKGPSSPTMVRSSTTPRLSVACTLLDAMGRRLGVFNEGACRLRLPGPGVYYLVPVDGGASRKLVCVE